MFGRRILVLVPHPDDEVVGCGAAIGRALRSCSGKTTIILAAYLTTGVPAGEQLWPWQRKDHAQRVERRRLEAKRAAELLGVQPLFFQDIPTRQLKQFLSPTRAHLVEFVREQRIETLWTPAYEGGHQDHDATNFLASTLRDAVDVWEFSEYNYFHGRVRSHEFIAPSGAEHVILLDDAERLRKKQLLAIYTSERGNLGYVGAEREVFRPLVRYDYSRPPHPGKLFYQRFQWVPYHPRVDYAQPEEVCRAMSEFAATQALAGADVLRARASTVRGGRP